MRRHSRTLLTCAFALSATPVAASPTQIWNCKMHNGESWGLALSSIWGVSLRKGTKVRWEDYKAEESDAVIVKATGPYRPKGKIEFKPDQLVFDPRSGELTVTTKSSRTARKGKCELEPTPQIQIKPQ
jgi:hypothetical protein